MRKTRKYRRWGLGIVVAMALVWFTPSGLSQVASGPTTGAMTGTVTSAKGPEAGVWVIAETDDLQTKFRKIVVTNDQGRYLLPELPKATYRVWVRGYGLVDSQPVTATPDQNLNLTAVVARTSQEAAQVYPASYWASLLEIPKPSEFPGTGPSGNGISPLLKTQTEWVAIIKGCQRCHQVGSKVTREIPDKERFGSSMTAWDHRVQRGQRGVEMNGFMTRFGRQRGLTMFADWSDRIAAGAVPPAPPRPTGIERNVVITMWNWGDNKNLMHDEIATDKRNPRLNANGPVYGVDVGNDWLTIVDPISHTAKVVRTPMRVDPSTVPPMFTATAFQPYRYFGEEIVWNDPAHPHNPMMDARGRVWITQAIRGPENPAWCHDGSLNTFADYFPLRQATSHVSYYEPKTGKFTLLDTCTGTHHLQFAHDENDTLYLSHPGTQAVGWINTKLYDQTGDERMSNGWCPIVVDTNADGKITRPWNEPGDKVRDPKRDTRVAVAAYGLIAHPVDGSVWGAMDEVIPGRIFRLQPGKNPPLTCIGEVYEPSVEQGFRPRGIDVDRNGVIWTALAGSSHLASFDRRKCKVLNGPTALGRHCDEGWTFYPAPGVTFKNSNVLTDFHYYNWVDQFNTLGLGENIPIATGSSSDSLLVLKPDTRAWVVLRVPYPMGFHSRGMDGRIDDPNAGWKGRGLYATYGNDASWHVEGGPKERGNLVKFQIRPDPLAR